MKKWCAYCVVFYVVLFGFSSLRGEGFRSVDVSEAPFKMDGVSRWVTPTDDVSIVEFGAVGDGKVKNTDAFRKAVAKAAGLRNGCRVVVPKGEWLTGAIHLKSNVDLHLEKGARIVFTDDPNDYLPPVRTTWEGVELLNYSPLVYAYGCTNVAITGKGTLAPKMRLWKSWFARPPEHMEFTRMLYEWCSKVTPVDERNAIALKGSNARPHLLQFNRCKNIVLDGFSIRESPFWTIHLYHSENAVVANLDVYAHGHNNDGIDVEMTRNVVVENCTFDQGDDAVVIKSGRNQDAWRLNRPSENIIIRNCTVKSGHVLLGIGSEMAGGVRNVYMHDCTALGDVINAYYVKTNRRRGGFVKSIWMDNCRIGRLRKHVIGVETDVLYQWAKFPTYEERITEIGDLHVRNVECEEADDLICINGDGKLPVKGVYIENVKAGKVRRGNRLVNCREVYLDGKELVK